MPVLLAIETAETACSAALIAEDGTGDEAVIGERHELVGRGHAERLIPAIMDLLGDRRPDAITVDCGPGSFTGLRVGIAAARGLALGWGVPVTGYSATALLAAAAFHQSDHDEVTVALTGGHGQLFVESYTRAPFAVRRPLASLAPADAAAGFGAAPLIVGSGAQALVNAGAVPAEWAALVLRAADVRLLPRAARALPPKPIYGRAPDARPALAVQPDTASR